MQNAKCKKKRINKKINKYVEHHPVCSSRTYSVHTNQQHGIITQCYRHRTYAIFFIPYHEFVSSHERKALYVSTTSCPKKLHVEKKIIINNISKEESIISYIHAYYSNK